MMLGVPTDNDPRRSADPPLATSLPPTPTAGQRSAEVRTSPASYPAAPHPNAYTVLGVPTDNNPRRSADPPLATPLPPTPTLIQCWTTIRGALYRPAAAPAGPLVQCHTATCRGPAGVAAAPLVPSSTLQCIAPLDSGTRYIVVETFDGIPVVTLADLNGHMVSIHNETNDLPAWWSECPPSEEPKMRSLAWSTAHAPSPGLSSTPVLDNAATRSRLKDHTQLPHPTPPFLCLASLSSSGSPHAPCSSDNYSLGFISNVQTLSLDTQPVGISSGPSPRDPDAHHSRAPPTRGTFGATSYGPRLSTRLLLSMSTNASTLADTLPSSIPKLDASGINWAIFSIHFKDAVQAKGFWGHYSGASARIVIPDGATATPAQEIEIAKWEKDECSAKSLLTQKIPDSALMRVHKKPTVKERWDAIVAEYTDKGAYAQNELRTKFLESKCPDKGDVPEFLDALAMQYEKLATVGVEISDTDYRSTILSSLPISLSNFASGQLAGARQYTASKTIAPDALISMICEESDRQRAQRTRRAPVKSKDGDRNEAMAFTPGKANPKWKGGRNASASRAAPDHYKDKCPKSSKSSTKDKGRGGAANAAIESDYEGEGAFAAHSVDGYTSDESSLPALQTVSDSSSGSDRGDDTDSDGDWFSEVSENDLRDPWADEAEPEGRDRGRRERSRPQPIH
ncbi:hypothetical protein D9615_008779 [Tricholomella constricta]|uniref:Uncharacterized protein n=1 Tax=Tricholomella constricta TaxID=117010 RepID=A0A8H5M1Z4_9AGAR|nr:hypothetical protein D9615_008779 [Tricholomella constricta]